MSEKNTSSILETIKKKLHKLDKKSENNDQPTQIDDEFQYISSENKIKKESIVAQNATLAMSGPNFDDLDLDDEDSIVTKAPAQQYQPVPQDLLNENEKESSSSLGSDEDQDLSFLDEDLKDGDLESQEEGEELDSLKEEVKSGFSEEDNSQFDHEKKSFDEIFEPSISSKSHSNELVEDFDLKELGLDGLENEDFSNQDMLQKEADKDPISIDDLEIEALLDDQKNSNEQILPKESGADNFNNQKLDSKNDFDESFLSDVGDFDSLEAELKEELDDHFDKVESEKSSLINDEELQGDDFLKDAELPKENQNSDLDLNVDLDLNLDSNEVENAPLEDDELESLDSVESDFAENLEEISEEGEFLDVKNEDAVNDLAADLEESELSFDDDLAEDDLLNSESLDSELEAKKQENENKMKQKIEVIPTQKSNQSSVSGLVIDSLSVNSNRVLKEETVRQVSDSVKKLVDAKNVVSGVASFSQSPALGEIAAHLMEPKIDKWFNENLPELVEKIVREEIKKLIPRD